MEMIAMLDGLGMNSDGSYPIGDVDPATSARYADNLNRDTSRPPPPAPPTGMRPYEPMTSYSLGAAEEGADAPAGNNDTGGVRGIDWMGWLLIGGAALAAFALIQKLMKKEPSGPVQGLGFPEPEMVEFPKKKRRKRRKSRRG